MNEDIIVPGLFFFTVIVLTLGIPLMRAYVRRQDRAGLRPPADPERDQRLERIEHAVDAMAIEIERISEGQRFVTRLLAERHDQPAALPAPREERR